MKKSEVSFLNVLFCLIVVFIHICSEPVTGLDDGSVSHIIVFTLWKLSGFVVQGFVLLSGMKMFLSGRKEGYPKYIKSRFFKVILPYMIAVFVYYMYFYYYNYYEFSLRDLGRYIIRGDLCAQFYFVVVILQFYLLKGVWEKVLEKVPQSLAVFASAVITAIGILCFGKVFGRYNDRVLTTYLIYWIMGCYIGKNYEQFIDALCRKKVQVASVFLPVAVLEVVLSYNKILPFFASEILHIIYCVSAILVCMVIAKYCSEYFMRHKLFKLVNASSYYIYLWHVLVIYVANQALDNFQISSLGIRFIIRGILAYFVSIFVCGAYVKIKEKIRR